VNLVAALWVKKNAVRSPFRATHHQGDAIMQAPAGEACDFLTAYGTTSVLVVPEKAKNFRTPKCISHMGPFAICEVLPILSGTDRIGKREADLLASKKPEFELVCRTLGEISQRGMPVKADPVWRIVAAASLAAIYRTYHEERNHQGKGNQILFPLQTEARRDTGAVRCRERLGGLLKYYERQAA